MSREEKIDNLPALKKDLINVLNKAEYLYDVPQFDLSYFEKLDNVIQCSDSRKDMLDAIEETKLCLISYLKFSHEGFKKHIIKFGK